MIRVVVVDDEALVRSGFQLILGAADDIEVVATTVGAEAVDAVRRESPDVVLLDIRMPDVDGLTVLRQLRALPQPPVVAMLTTFDADEYIVTALRTGAAGFLLKDTEPDQLAQLVRTLAAGGVVMSPKASRAVWQSHPGAGTVDDEEVTRVGRLTDREREVLVLIAEGLSNADIGGRIHLSAGTVKDHVSAIFTKLRVGSRVQAALLAQRAGLLDGGRGRGERDEGQRRRESGEGQRRGELDGGQRRREYDEGQRGRELDERQRRRESGEGQRHGGRGEGQRRSEHGR